MTRALYGLGRFCVRYKLIVLGIWLVVLLGLGGWAASVGSLTNDNLTLPGTDSQAATDLLQDQFPEQANGTNPVVFEAPEGEKLTASKYKDAIDRVADDYKARDDVNEAPTPFTSEGADNLSDDKRIGYIALNLKTSPSDLTQDEAQELVDIAMTAKGSGLTVAVDGYVGQKVSKPATEDSEVIGLTAAVIVLLFTFGTVVAMGLPLVTAIFGLVTGLSIIGLLGHVVDVPSVAPTLATMIGLGVGIDYALFIVTRHRDGVRAGLPYDEAIARSVATSGGAVVFAGSTVMIALLSLAVVQIPLVTTLGYTAALAVLVTVLAAITLLPAVLALLGARIEWLKLPFVHKQHGSEPRIWGRWAHMVADRPVVSTVVAVVVLAAMAIPALDMTLGQQDNGVLPEDTQSRQSYDLLTKGFGPGENGPLLVSVDLSEKPAQPDQQQLDEIDQQAQEQEDQIAEQLEAQGVPPDQAQQQAEEEVQPQADEQKEQASNPATDPRLQDLRKDMEDTDGVQQVSQPLVNDSGTAAVYNVIPTTAPSDLATEDLVQELRDTVIPEATKGQDMTAYVGGTTAGYIDLADEISDKLVETIAIVVGLSFLLLLLAFRSILIPLTAGVMNLISIAAAFGIVTAVFEKGWGNELIGLDTTIPIVSFVPLMMFAILFGLSMDYEVFLMSHVREKWQQAGENRTAVVQGLAGTGRIITSAALIMVSVFLAFVINGDPTVKQFGVGMAAAVALDATLVRCVLVPAVMVLLDRANWWLPKWLDRLLPNFSIEGEGYFEARDAARAARAAAAGHRHGGRGD